MSCVLTNVGCFYDIAAVQRYLFPNWRKDEGGKDTDGWEDADWSWSGEESNSVSLNVKTSLNAVAFQKEGSEIEAGPPDQDAWMQECSIALSPTSELMVIAFEQKAVFLQQKWDPEEKDGVDSKYHIIYKGVLNQEEGECITSTMCVPLASQKRSSHGAPDWTCVVLGFTSGYVRMYTETGALLLSQLLHEDPVLKLKGRTYEMPRHAGVAEQQEELTILYPTALVTVDGFSLFQSLRACRNQLAKAAASGSDNIQPPPLVYKKWGLQQQDAIVDHISTGVVTSCSFDQLHAASTLGGYNASVKMSPPVCHKYITTGAGPFLGFFYALEGSAQPLFSDVALAVASKLKSAIFSAASGWFGFGGNKQNTDTQAPSKTKPRVEPAISLPIRFGLPDVRRHGDTIVLAPGMRLAASTDSFGRVSLIDVNRGVAVRMWKGYRDAQCGWIQVVEDIQRERSSDHGSKKARHSAGSKHGPRVALFLVIYAPRRGIIEVWNTQQGPRIAAFNVPKSCRLLYPGYGVMGLNSLSVQDSRTKPHMLQCCLLEPSGLVRTFNVPFHLALSDKNSKRAHDLHLIKKLSSLLHHRRSLKEPIVEPISRILQDLKLTAYKQQALDKALSAKGMSSEELFHVIRVLIVQLGGQDPSCLDYESRRLLQYCGCQVKLIEAYTKIQGLHRKAGKTEGGDERVGGMEEDERTGGMEGDETGTGRAEEGRDDSGASTTKTTAEDLASKLKQDLTSVESLLDDISSYLSSSGQGRVHFATDYSMDPATFLSCFKTMVQRANKEGKEGTMKREETEEKQGENEEEEVTTAPTEELKMKVTFKENLAEEKRLALGMFMFRPCLVDSCSSRELCDVFREAEIGTHDIHMLLLQVWLSNESEFLKDAVTTIANLHLLMSEVSAPTTPFSSRPLGGVNIPPGEIEIIHGLLFETRHVGGAEVAGMVMRSLVGDMDGPRGAASRASQDSDQMDVDGDHVTTPSSDLSLDWVDVSMWDVLIEQLRDLMVLQRLLQIKLNKATSTKLQSDYSRGWSIEGSLPPIDVTVPVISVKHIMEGGKGIFAEMVARWVAHYRIPPSFLSKCSVSSHVLNLSRESSRVEDADVEQDHSEAAAVEQLQETLHTLCSRFPHSLEYDVLQAHCTWEYVVQWNKNPEVTGFLACGLHHLRSIRNPVLQHGVSSMMWHTFMVKKVSATAFLMDKVGKAPKDRLCRRDVGLSETAMERFLGFTADLLDCIYQVEAESSLTPIFDVEDLWQHIQGPAPLVELAVNQTLPNHSLVDVHKQLCTIMHAVMTFGMKSVKVLQLFDYKTKNAFFKALGTTFIPSSNEIDYGLVKLRQQFLLRLVTAAALTLPPNHQSEPDTTSRITSDRRDSTVSSDEGGSIVPLENPKKLPKTHLAYVWSNVAQQLALALRVDIDYVKRHFVCELYNCGYDAVAQELVVTVAEQTEMAVQLIHIVGQRLAQELIIGADSVTVERQSRLPPSLITWLKSLSGENLRCPHPPISDTAHLAGQAVGLLPDTHNQYALALQLIEAVGSLT